MSTTPIHVRSSRSTNLGNVERWISLIAGAGLVLSALTRGGPTRRLLRGAAAASLLSRGATGFCAMKSTLQGHTSLGEGLKEQLQRTTDQLRAVGIPRIDAMETLYGVELQELYSAESQLAQLLESLTPSVTNAALAARLDEYGVELRTREGELHDLLSLYDLAPNQHPDDAMSALVKETRKMAQVCAPALRDAALAASIQRIVHYKMAGYGTVAAYAKSLNRVDDAGRFALLADRDKAIDVELTDLAKGALNPQAKAAVTIEAQATPGGLRPH